MQFVIEITPMAEAAYGLFPKGVTLENHKNLNQSLPRNRLISKVFYFHKICETWGRGIDLIVNECQKAGHPEPFFTQAGDSTLLTLPSSQRIGVTTIKQPIDDVAHLLTVRQGEILKLLKEHKALSTNEILSLMASPPSERTLRNELTHLKILECVDATGKTSTRKWSLRR